MVKLTFIFTFVTTIASAVMAQTSVPPETTSAVESLLDDPTTPPDSLPTELLTDLPTATSTASLAVIATAGPVSIPTNFVIPSEAMEAFSSVVKNPGQFLSQADQVINQLPTQFQGQARSALAEASKSIIALHNSASAADTNARVSFAFGALAITAVIASFL